MIYLTQLRLNPRDRRVRRDLADCREMHRTVLAGFPQAVSGAAPRDAFGVLYRVEAGPLAGIRLLVQSTEAPDWPALPVGYLDTPGDGVNPVTKEIGPAYDSLRPGQILRFRIRANPTKRLGKSVSEKWAGKRIALSNENDQIGWLERKGEASGFSVVSVRSSPEVPDIRVVPDTIVTGRRAGLTMTFGSIVFDGLLRVTEASRFRGALTAGIGSGKAYGFGLLSIAPA